MEFEKCKEFLGSRQYASLVGRKLREAREWSGLYRADVAGELGIGEDQLRKIERGTWLPTVGEAAALAELYMCSLDWALGIGGDPRTRGERIELAEGEELEPASNLSYVDSERRGPEPQAKRRRAPGDHESRRRMCYSKHRFRSESAAINAAIGSSRVYAQPMRQYRCPVCGGWHLTSQATVDPRPMALAA